MLEVLHKTNNLSAFQKSLEETMGVLMSFRHLEQCTFFLL